MFENFIAIPCVACNVYGDTVRVNPEHVVSITWYPEEKKYGAKTVPAYISIRLTGA